MLQVSFDISQSSRTKDNRLIVDLSSEDAKIVKCDPPFKLKEIFDSQWEKYIHRVEASNKVMLKFVNSWLASYIDNQRRTWTTHKLLNL